MIPNRTAGTSPVVQCGRTMFVAPDARPRFAVERRRSRHMVWVLRRRALLHRHKNVFTIF